MTMRNVGIVFGPTLGIPACVFTLMLGEFNWVFNVDGPEEQGEDAEDSPARRNSRHYSDPAADKLLDLAGRSLRGEGHVSHPQLLLTPSTAPPGDSDGEGDPLVQEDNGADPADDGRDTETPVASN